MTEQAMKTCPICRLDLKKLSISPATCEGGHTDDERACPECWEVYLSAEVEDKAPRDIKCMFEHDKRYIISKTELKRLARKGTLERYEVKLKESTHCRCQARCWASKRDMKERNSLSVLQPHSREHDGRVFTCKFCEFKTCTDCDRPEHENETCEQYRSRVIDHPQHVRDEAATTQKFKRCPGCDTAWEWDPKKKGCGYTSCDACKFRFCGRCLVPWVGEGGAYALGKMAHGPACKYRIRPKESRHGLKKRHKPDSETQARIDAEDEAKKAKREAKSKAEEEELGPGNSGGEFKVVKKRKLATKV